MVLVSTLSIQTLCATSVVLLSTSAICTKGAGATTKCCAVWLTKAWKIALLVFRFELSSQQHSSKRRRSSKLLPDISSSIMQSPFCRTLTSFLIVRATSFPDTAWLLRPLGSSKAKRCRGFAVFRLMSPRFSLPVQRPMPREQPACWACTKAQDRVRRSQSKHGLYVPRKM